MRKRARQGERSAVAGWLMVVMSVGLLVGLIWDADGDPTTENLPSVVLCAAERDAVELQEQRVDGDEANAAPRVLGKNARLRVKSFLRLMLGEQAHLFPAFSVLLRRGP
jgi:hypothetical protein